MGKPSLVLALLLAPGPGAASAAVDDVFQLRTLGEVELDPSGERAVVVVGRSSLESNAHETHLLLVELGSGRTTPLTSPGTDAHPRWSPDGASIAYLSRRDGPRGIWRVPAAGGEPAELVRAEADVERFAWLPDGSGLLYTLREPAPAIDGVRRVGDHRRARLYLGTHEGGEAEALTPAGEHVGGFDVARGTDGRTRVVYTSQPSPEVRDGRLHSDLVILDLETLERRALVTQPGLDHSPRFSPDGMEVGFVSMGGRADWLGNYDVFTVRVDGTALHDVTEGFDERVEYHLAEREAPFRWSSDGSRLRFLGLRGIHQRLWVTEVRGGSIAPVSDADESKVASSFDVAPDGTVLAVLSDPESPPELHAFSPGGSPAVRLTAVNADYPLVGAGRTEPFTYEAKDGLELQALLVKPPDFEPGRPYPLLVVVHGGPMGVFDASFAPRRGVYPVDAFARSGFLVLLPNPRGSGGFGERFRKAAVSQWGLADFEDVLRGVDALIERGLADPERLGIMGWSYGGYMTAWAVTQTDRFRAASVGAAITDPYSFWGSTDIPEFVEAYFGGKPWEESASYLRHAPIHHVSRVSTPTLLQHGEADRRVPLAQGLSFHRALESRGVTVEMFTYPGEGHSIEKPEHLKHALERNLEWFERWLGERPRR